MFSKRSKRPVAGKRWPTVDIPVHLRPSNSASAATSPWPRSRRKRVALRLLLAVLATVGGLFVLLIGALYAWFLLSGEAGDTPVDHLLASGAALRRAASKVPAVGEPDDMDYDRQFDGRGSWRYASLHNKSVTRHYFRLRRSRWRVAVYAPVCVTPVRVVVAFKGPSVDHCTVGGSDDEEEEGEGDDEGAEQEGQDERKEDLKSFRWFYDTLTSDVQWPGHQHAENLVAILRIDKEEEESALAFTRAALRLFHVTQNAEAYSVPPRTPAAAYVLRPHKHVSGGVPVEGGDNYRTELLSVVTSGWTLHELVGTSSTHTCFNRAIYLSTPRYSGTGGDADADGGKLFAGDGEYVSTRSSVRSRRYAKSMARDSVRFRQAVHRHGLLAQRARVVAVLEGPWLRDNLRSALSDAAQRRRHDLIMIDVDEDLGLYALHDALGNASVVVGVRSDWRVRVAPAVAPPLAVVLSLRGVAEPPPKPKWDDGSGVRHRDWGARSADPGKQGYTELEQYGGDVRKCVDLDSGCRQHYAALGVYVGDEEVGDVVAAVDTAMMDQ